MKKDYITIDELVEFSKLTTEQQLERLLQMQREAFPVVPPPTTIRVEDFSSYWEQVESGRCQLYTADGKRIVYVRHSGQPILYWVEKNDLKSEEVAENTELQTKWIDRKDIHWPFDLPFTTYENERYYCVGHMFCRDIDLTREMRQMAQVVGYNPEQRYWLARLHDNRNYAIITDYYMRDEIECRLQRH